MSLFLVNLRQAGGFKGNLEGAIANFTGKGAAATSGPGEQQYPPTARLEVNSPDLFTALVGDSCRFNGDNCPLTCKG